MANQRREAADASTSEWNGSDQPPDLWLLRLPEQTSDLRSRASGGTTRGGSWHLRSIDGVVVWRHGDHMGSGVAFDCVPPVDLGM